MSAAPPLESTDRLPTPAERPTAAVVVYDSDCRICRGQVARLARLDRRERLAFRSLHDPDLGAAYPGVDRERLMHEMLVVTSDGARYWGADAFRYVAGELPGLWWLSVLMHIPGTMPLWRLGYRQFAKRRYRFGRVESCDDGSCAVPRRG